MRIKRSHDRRQLIFGKPMLHVIHAQSKLFLQQGIQAGDIGQINLLYRPTILITGEMKIGQRQLTAVRKMTTHQQMMTKMRLWPVRGPEIAHQIIALVLHDQVKTVH